VSDLSNVTPRYLGSEQKGRVLLLRWKTADTVFVVLNFGVQVQRYSSTVDMSFPSTLSTTFQSLSACMTARSSYAYFRETVVG